MYDSRIFLYKAKRTDNKEWVKGYLWAGSDHAYIIPSTCGVGYDNKTNFLNAPAYEIDINTLCRSIGRLDKKTNIIWEGDILKGYDYPFLSDGNHNYFAEVVWVEECCAFGLYTHKNPRSSVGGVSAGNITFFDDFDMGKWEIIGNIYDNKDLIEEYHR